MAVLDRNRWPLSLGIDGRFHRNAQVGQPRGPSHRPQGLAGPNSRHDFLRRQLALMRVRLAGPAKRPFETVVLRMIACRIVGACAARISQHFGHQSPRHYRISVRAVGAGGARLAVRRRVCSDVRHASLSIISPSAKFALLPTCQFFPPPAKLVIFGRRSLLNYASAYTGWRLDQTSPTWTKDYCARVNPGEEDDMS